MSAESVHEQMKKMKLLFLGFAILTPVGFVLAISNISPFIGFVLFAMGILLGTVCAFTPCPCCSKLSGVFFKYIFGGVFPMGFCFHCGKSYLRGHGCNNDS